MAKYIVSPVNMQFVQHHCINDRGQTDSVISLELFHNKVIFAYKAIVFIYTWWEQQCSSTNRKSLIQNLQETKPVWNGA